MKALITVIVPVYNVEKYLERCLYSLENQTLNELVVYVINDGSTDQSLDIVKKFVNRNPSRFKLFNKINGGLSDARNYGLKFVETEYLGFIDGDDYVENDFYEKLLTKAIADQSDIVLSDIVYEWEQSNKQHRLSGLKQDKLGSYLFMSPLFAWNKLYRTSLFKENHFEYSQGLWYEDIPVSFPLFALANKVSYEPDTYVHYLQRSGSIMATFTHKKLWDIFEILNQVILRFKDIKLIEKYNAEIEYLHIEQLLLFGMFRFLRSDESYDLVRKAYEIMHKNFPKWRTNKFIRKQNLVYQMFLLSFHPVFLPIYKWIIQLKGLPS